MIKMTNISKEWKIVWETENLVSNSFVNFIKHKFGSMPDNYAEGIPCFSDSNLGDLMFLKNKLLEYDISIGLARGGLWQSYVLSLLGLPMAVVDLKRKGNGAAWKPIDDLESLSLKNKKILVCDQDCRTGKTLRKATKEIEKYNPKSLGLFLLFQWNTLKDSIPANFDEIHFPIGRDYSELKLFEDYLRLYNRLK